MSDVKNYTRAHDIAQALRFNHAQQDWDAVHAAALNALNDADRRHAERILGLEKLLRDYLGRVKPLSQHEPCFDCERVGGHQEICLVARVERALTPAPSTPRQPHDR